MAEPVRILGLDPGTARTGYGIIEREGNRTVLIDAGLLSTPAGEEPAHRLVSLADQLNEVIAAASPAAVAIEKLYFQTNVTTAMSVSEARGVLLATCAAAKLPIAEYTPLQVKQSVTSYGGADKRQVALMVTKLLGLKTTPKPDDVTDAIAIALCHDQWRTIPKA